MSMKEYPVVERAAFFIDREVAAYVNLAIAEELPEELQGLSRKEQVEKALQGEYEEYRLDSVAKAYGALEEFDVNVCYCYIFTGDAAPLDEDFAKAADRETVTFDADCISWYPLGREPKFFKAAYNDIDEVVDEVKAAFAVGPFFPEDFDFKKHFYAINGTEFC